MMKYIALYSFVLFILLDWHTSINAKEMSDKGTLIVSYQIGPQGDRLERVRVLLISETGNEQFYPKGDAYVEDGSTHSRMIAIENLNPGKYVVKFLVPNQDGLFNDIPPREIEIKKNEVSRIDEHIEPNYATLKAKAEAKPEGQTFKILPTITLYDFKGNIRAQSTVGKLVSHTLLPGSYKLSFEPVNNFHTPDSVELELIPGQNSGLLIGNYIAKEQPTQEVAAASGFIPPPPYPGSSVIYNPNSSLIITQVNGQLTVRSNLPYARWTLLRYNTPVRTLTGPVVNLQVLNGDGYQIRPEPIEGYNVTVSPSSTFSIYYAQTVYANIEYTRTTGSIRIDSPFPEGQTLGVLIASKNSRPLNIKLKAQNGKISWQSSPLPTGLYDITYTLPKGMDAVPSEHIHLRAGDRFQLSPKFSLGSSLRITSNIPEAVYLLKGPQGQSWKGQGRDYSFKELEAGSYTLSFSTQDSTYFIAPKDMRFYITGKENKEIRVEFQLAGLLIIDTNVDNAIITIKGTSRSLPTLEAEITAHTRNFTLPQGRYRIVSTLGANDVPEKIIAPDPIDITIKPFTTERVTITYKSEQNLPQEKNRRLFVNTNINETTFKVHKAGVPDEDVVGTFSGKSNQLTLPTNDAYEIIFDEVPNYQTPQPITVTITNGEQKTVNAEYIPIKATVNVPAGRAIIGNATTEESINELPGKIVYISDFSIGTYEITNAQYANWLNAAMKAKKIAYISEADGIGKVIDLSGKLLCKTFEADHYSQISTQPRGQNNVIFIPMPGKDNYPIINVTWYGANAYCKDNNCRLLTEAEWEKAAGMQPEKTGSKLTKFRYGFSKNTIDRTWANYKDSIANNSTFQVLTTPIGFYNGDNLLPLSTASRNQQKTNLARSPYGAFDMSGNVWEWVSDWFEDGYYQNMSETDPKGPESGTLKVAKGGCYDSLAEGVRVSERIGLPPDHADAFTGFRIAIDR